MPGHGLCEVVFGVIAVSAQTYMDVETLVLHVAHSDMLTFMYWKRVIYIVVCLQSPIPGYLLWGARFFRSDRVQLGCFGR